MRKTLAAIALLLVGAAACKMKPSAADIKDVVQVTVDDGGFKPASIPAKRGRPLTLVFQRTSDKTCATEVVIASEHIRKDLPLHASVPITFIPEKAGDIHFACAMNMVTGTISVIQ